MTDASKTPPTEGQQNITPEEGRHRRDVGMYGLPPRHGALSVKEQESMKAQDEAKLNENIREEAARAGRTI